MEKLGKLKITTESIKVLTDTELQGVRGGLGSAECSGACTGGTTASCVCPTHTDTAAGCVAEK
jgi:hypothetical protein